LLIAIVLIVTNWVKLNCQFSGFIFGVEVICFVSFAYRILNFARLGGLTGLGDRLKNQFWAVGREALCVCWPFRGAEALGSSEIRGEARGCGGQPMSQNRDMGHPVLWRNPGILHCVQNDDIKTNSGTASIRIV
jgi:hypothetical protein